MKTTTCHGWTTYDPQQGLSKITGEATKHQQGNTTGPQSAKNKSWKKRYLTFLSKFQNKMKKHKKHDNIKAAAGGSSSKHHHGWSPKNRTILLSSQIMEECSNLVQVIRHTATDCFAVVATAAAAAAADNEEDDHHQPYMQLDQVNYGVMKREAFGPVYLVT